jgi:hypothetical protein
MRGYYAVDLDGTLAHYEGWNGGAIGAPIPLMVERVKRWLAEGRDVKIMTARVSLPEQAKEAERAIQEWCLLHIGRELPVTCIKDYHLIELWDDRAIQVVPNTGERADGKEG